MKKYELPVTSQNFFQRRVLVRHANASARSTGLAHGFSHSLWNKKSVFVSALSILLLPLLIGCSQKQACKPETMEPKNVETMSFIPGGSFMMGVKDGGSFKDHPQKAVYVGSFYLDKTEVTNAMYKEYLKAKECAKPPRYIDDKEKGGDDLPVVDVSYNDAKGFCEFYGKRLPTEAEWEYAARGGLSGKRFPWGDNESADMMNYRGTGSNWAVNVKSYPPNRYGLYDMAGNVREWVEDTYRRDFYICPPKNPKSLDNIFGGADECRVNPVNRSNGIFKVNRGGSWHYVNGYPPTVDFRSFDKASYKGNDLGFRCASRVKEDGIAATKMKEFKEMMAKELGFQSSENNPENVTKEEIRNTFENKFLGHTIGQE